MPVLIMVENCKTTIMVVSLSIYEYVSDIFLYKVRVLKLVIQEVTNTIALIIITANNKCTITAKKKFFIYVSSYCTIGQI